MKDLHIDNYEMMVKTIDDKVNWKISHAYGLEESILLKCLYCPRQRPNSKGSFPEVEQTILNLYELQKTLNSQSSLEKNKVGNVTLSDSKLH